MTLQELQTLFPPTSNGYASGRMPIAFVNANLGEIKQIVKCNKLRRFYRGPRPFRGATDTHKEDAVAMLLYKA